MPEPSELPESIREFAYRNAAEVESGRDFDIHVDRLIKAVEQILAPRRTRVRRRPVAQLPDFAGPVAPSTSAFLPLVRGAFLALAARERLQSQRSTSCAAAAMASLPAIAILLGNAGPDERLSDGATDTG
jgi:hypothetical protein